MSARVSAAHWSVAQRRVALLLGAVGAGELATGAALLIAPGWVCRALGASPVAEAWIWLRWIGIFVAAVGALYLFPLFGGSALRGLRFRFALEATSLVRLLVAAFVAISILTDALETGWALVGVYDAAVGVGQLALLVRGVFSWENR